MRKENNKQYAVLGLGRWGLSLAKTLFDNGNEVLAVDNDEERVALLGENCTYALVGDLADEAVLKSIGIDSFMTVIVAIGENMQASIICALICKQLGAKYVIAKANNKNHAKILEKIGVDKVIIPEDDSAVKTAHILMRPSVIEMLESNEGYSIVKIAIPEGWIGKTISEVNVRRQSKLNILFISNDDGKREIPSADSKFATSDYVTLGGLAEDVDAFIKKI